MENFKKTEKGPEFISKIALRFFRHDEKEGDPLKNDYDIELSSGGKAHAKEQARETNFAQAIAFGSPRVRTQETAGFIMAGANDEITGEESLAELKQKIDSEVRHGSKINVDQRLNFELEGDTEYAREAVDAYKRGDLMKFIVEKSDAVAKETGDDESSTYTRMASSIALIIRKYLSVAPRWNDLVKDKTKNYDATLERFFGTHQSIQESFLAKVIEITKGTSERDRFVGVLDSGGFGHAEGFEVDILTKDNSSEPIIRINYKKEGKTPKESFIFEEDLSTSILDQIISDQE